MKTKNPGKWRKFNLPEPTTKPRKKASAKLLAVKEAKEKLAASEDNFDAFEEK